MTLILKLFEWSLYGLYTVDIQPINDSSVRVSSRVIILGVGHVNVDLDRFRVNFFSFSNDTLAYIYKWEILFSF